MLTTKRYIASMVVFRILMTFALMTCPSVSIAEPAHLAALDKTVAEKYPDTIFRIVTSIGRPDDNGLLGRNREWGSLYSVRFQYGAGRALRHGLASNNSEIAALARQAMDVGLQTIQPDGGFPASLPVALFGNQQPGVSDQASAAAFFLSDVCPALLVTGYTGQDQMRIRLAIAWLGQHRALLLARDKRAPNRLLIDALAFGACGQILQDSNTVSSARVFIDAALALTQNDGVFIEAGGSDTSYQAVNLVVATEIIALDIAGVQEDQLRAAVSRGALWLSGRIGSDGVLDSAANTRTCANEAFLGRPKAVDLREVFRALAYAQALEDGTTYQVSVFEAWLRTQPDPCAETE